MQRKSFVFCFLILFLLQGFSDSWAETLTMSTYYPAPFGAYDRLQLVPRSPLSGACNAGTFYFEDISGDIRFCDISENWNFFPGVWKQSGASVFLSDPANPMVGVGTQTPLEHLHVFGSGAQSLKVETTDSSDAALKLANSVGSFGLRVVAGTGDLQFFDYTSSQSRLEIEPTGNVGIGITSPVVKLDVNGGIRPGAMSNPDCTPSRAGAIRWASTDVQLHYCDGSVWQIIAIQSLPATCGAGTIWTGPYTGCTCGSPGGVIWEGSQTCTCEPDGTTWSCVPTCPAPPVPCP